MHGTETLEQACADAWPAVVEDEVGQWRLRAATHLTGAGRLAPFTGRANSALAVGDPGMPVSKALAKAREFADHHGIEPMVQAVCGSAVEAELDSNGWRPNTEHRAGHLVSVQTGPLDRPVTHAATIEREPTPRWWELTVDTAEPTPAQRHVLGSGQVGYGLAVHDGVAAGAVRAVVVGDLVYVSSLAVRQEHRRLGLASALMAAAGAWGRDRGATTCVLQVAVGNTTALALYARLGFSEQHRYRYWVPASTCEDHRL